MKRWNGEADRERRRGLDAFVKAGQGLDALERAIDGTFEHIRAWRAQRDVEAASNAIIEEIVEQG